MRAKWTEPRLFEPPPVQDPHRSLVLRVNAYGPENRLEVWVTHLDRHGDEDAIQELLHCTLTGFRPSEATEILGDQLRVLMSRLSPF